MNLENEEDYSFLIIEAIRAASNRLPDLRIPDIIYSAISYLKIKEVKDIRSICDSDIYTAFCKVVERESEDN